MYYELWDLRTANLVDEFATVAEALDYVRWVFETCGEELASGFALGINDAATGHGKQIADGIALVELSRSAVLVKADRS